MNLDTKSEFDLIGQEVQYLIQKIKKSLELNGKINHGNKKHVCD